MKKILYAKRSSRINYDKFNFYYLLLYLNVIEYYTIEHQQELASENLA